MVNSIIDQIDLDRPEADELSLTLRSANLDVALRIVAAGMPLFPVTVFQDHNGRWKKKPAIRGWQHLACTDADQIGKWWSEFPQAVPGIQLGGAGLIVIDADRHDGGADGVSAFAALRDRHGGDSYHPRTLTAGFGEHHYYVQPAGRLLGNGEGQLPGGINVRGAGGFVVAPGSIRPDGAIWEPRPGAPELPTAFRAGQIPELPSWLVEILAPGFHQDRSNATASAEPTPSRERAYAAKALEACVAELEQTS